MTSSLDSYGHCSLMLCTSSGNSSRKDLSSLGNVSFQFVNILVIDLVVLFATEYANFLSSASASSLHGRIAFLCFIVSHVLLSFLIFNLSSDFRFDYGRFLRLSLTSLVKWKSFVFYAVWDVHKSACNCACRLRSGLRHCRSVTAIV